jgi:hypothetical protein
MRVDTGTPAGCLLHSVPVTALQATRVLLGPRTPRRPFVRLEPTAGVVRECARTAVRDCMGTRRAYRPLHALVLATLVDMVESPVSRLQLALVTVQPGTIVLRDQRVQQHRYACQGSTA